MKLYLLSLIPALILLLILYRAETRDIKMPSSDRPYDSELLEPQGNNK